MPLTAQDVAEITRLLEESDFLEMRLEHEGFKLTLKRAGARGADIERATATPAVAATTAAATPAAATPTSTTAPASAAYRLDEPPAADPSFIDVTAPLLGTFYRAPRPGAEPYVEVGSVLEADMVIGIIEVMKLMYSVRAEVPGTVVEILVADGAAVEQGQVLLRVSPGGGGG